MKYINRYTFLKQSFNLGGLVLLSPVANSFSMATGDLNNNNISEKDDMLLRLVKANDVQVAKLLKSPTTATLTRKIGFDFAILTASWYCTASAYYQSPLIIPFA